jgi:hypothetical protein
MPLHGGVVHMKAYAHMNIVRQMNAFFYSLLVVVSPTSVFLSVGG